MSRFGRRSRWRKGRGKSRERERAKRHPIWDTFGPLVQACPGDAHGRGLHERSRLENHRERAEPFSEEIAEVCDTASSKASIPEAQPNNYKEVVNPDGSVLRGEFRKDKIYNGSGALLFPDGKVHEGTWLEGKLQGQVKVTYPNGNVYIGEVTDHGYSVSRDGYGVMTYSTGEVYEGMWVKGDYDGQGTLTSKGYRIECRDGKIYNGSGVLLFPNGNVYEGTWVEGKLQGQAKVSFSKGSTYVGELVDQKRHGYGVMTCRHGSVYEGNWKDGERHGQGKLTNVDGSVVEGEWRDGKFCGDIINNNYSSSGNVGERRGEDSEEGMATEGQMELTATVKANGETERQ